MMIATPLTVTSCSNQLKPPTPIVKVVNPTVQPDVRPALNAIVAVNDALQSTVNEQQNTINEQRTSIQQAIETYDELKAKLADQKPLEVLTTKLSEQLRVVQTRNMFMETQNVTLKKSLEEQEKLTDEAIEKALKKDEESREWQRVIVTKDDLLARIVVERDSAIKQREHFQVEASKASVYKRWVIGLACGFIGWLIIKNILMVYFPASRFLTRV
jgi:hypothetical protein